MHLTNVIIINGCCASFPDKLFDQLAENGRMAFFEPIGTLGKLVLIKKSKAGFSKTYIDEMFVPEITEFEKTPEFVF